MEYMSTEFKNVHPIYIRPRIVYYYLITNRRNPVQLQQEKDGTRNMKNEVENVPTMRRI